MRMHVSLLYMCVNTGCQWGTDVAGANYLEYSQLLREVGSVQAGSGSTKDVSRGSQLNASAGKPPLMSFMISVHAYPLPINAHA
jgi:hypothetical protein